MATFKIDNGDFHLKDDSFIEVLRFNKENISVFFIGKIQFDKKSCENIIFKEREKINIHDKFDDSIFRRLNGDYFVVVVEGNKISIFVGYSTHLLYIWNQRNKADWNIIISDDENYIQNKRQNYDNLTLGLFSHYSFYIPRGHFLSSDDFILPGMKMQIDRKTGKYSQTWFYPINQMVVRDDHKNIAIEVAETLVNEFSLNSVYDKNLKTIQVSSGLDSALFVAAAEQSRMDYIPINFLEFEKTDEQHGANTICKYFGKKIKFLNRGTTNDKKKFTSKTDISSYLNLTKNLLKISSGQFILNHSSLLAGYYLGSHTSFDGSSYPTQLCIKHHTHYPVINPRKGKLKSKFQPEIYSELRQNYSESFAKHELESFFEGRAKDIWGISELWPEIHPFYWSYLGFCFTQRPDNTHSLSINKFPYLSFLKKGNHFEDSIKKNGNEIISKILLDKTFKKELISPNPIIATKLTRIISFLMNAVRANNKSKDISKSGIFKQVRPGISSQMIRILHSVKFDNVLTNYPKWHLFKAFELLSGKDFFKINRMTPYKKMLSFFYHKVLSKNKNIHYSIISNKSVNRFCSNHRIDEKFNTLVNESTLPVKKAILEIEKSIFSSTYSDVAKFWFLNKKMNIVFMSLFK
jgi:hypothetical protein